MKRLVVFCFCLLFGVLSALSILNFDGEAVGAMEGKMSRMMIVKPQGMPLPPLPLLRRSGRSVRRRPPHPVQPHAALRGRRRNCRHTRRTRCSSRNGCVRRRRC